MFDNEKGHTPTIEAIMRDWDPEYAIVSDML